jgi:hypothetical protein
MITPARRPRARCGARGTPGDTLLTGTPTPARRGGRSWRRGRPSSVGVGGRACGGAASSSAASMAASVWLASRTRSMRRSRASPPGRSDAPVRLVVPRPERSAPGAGRPTPSKPASSKTSTTSSRSYSRGRAITGGRVVPRRHHPASGVNPHHREVRCPRPERCQHCRGVVDGPDAGS